jgi:hypothetical protein
VVSHDTGDRILLVQSKLIRLVFGGWVLGRGWQLFGWRQFRKLVEAPSAGTMRRVLYEFL